MESRKKWYIDKLHEYGAVALSCQARWMNPDTWQKKSGYKLSYLITARWQIIFKIMRWICTDRSLKMAFKTNFYKQGA
jgi:hypothetical protein